MYTVCPACTKQFHIYAEHIAAASGQVRCGFCHKQFNALENLHDEPLTSEELHENTQQGPELSKELEVEPQFKIPEEEKVEENLPAEEVLISTAGDQTDSELETAISEIGVQNSTKVPDIKPIVEPAAEIESVPESEPEPDFDLASEDIVSPPPEEPTETPFVFPEDEEPILEPPRRNRVAAVFWTLAAILAVTGLVLQMAWFNRDRLLMDYPQLTPYVKQICKELGCRLIRQRDARAITLVNRDVRLHPSYQDSLLVNATMKNDLAVRQPYPRVQLTLFDTSGGLLGYREFTPDDYLDDSIAIDEGMPVDSPVHFVLEVSGPTAGAVSFEFRFL